MRKEHAAGQGIVASENLATIYQREIFFPVDPATLDWLDHEEVAELNPSGYYLELDTQPFMKYLPDLEAEIFWLIFDKRKHQKDIAKLLGLSQPTVSYRYRRVIVKLRYLMTLNGVPLKRVIDDLPFLKEREREILYDLFFYLNQEKVGQKHDVRQSTVKWIFTKTKRKLEELERKDPDKWFNHLGLMLLLDHNFNIRVLN